MQFILDSHTLIWAVDTPSRVSRSAERALLNPAAVRYISTATIWEIAIKFGKGQLTAFPPLSQMDR